MRVYGIKNIISGAFLRKGDGEIMIFVSSLAAANYMIEQKINGNYYEIAEFRR